MPPYIRNTERTISARKIGTQETVVQTINILTQNTGAEVQQQTGQTTPIKEWGSLVFKQTLQNSSTANNIPEEYNAIYARFTTVMRGVGKKRVTLTQDLLHDLYKQTVTSFRQLSKERKTAP
jgi:hypothetical protein